MRPALVGQITNGPCPMSHLMSKSSACLPASSAETNQPGRLPCPVQVFPLPAGSTYFGAPGPRLPAAALFVRTALDDFEGAATAPFSPAFLEGKRSFGVSW